MPAQTHLVSFRLSADAQRRLTALAAAQGQSPGEFARELVFSQLEQTEKTQATVEEISAELAHLKSLLALSVEGLLVALTSPKPITPQMAKNWVNDRLRKPRAGDPREAMKEH